MESRVFITGATGGFGRMVCVECAGRGWDLYITDLNENRLAGFAQTLANIYGVKVDYCPCDMSDEASRGRLVEAITQSGVRFHMMILVAGIDPEGPFMECSRQTITRTFNINIVSPLDMIRSLVCCRDQGKPLRILNVCSMAGFFPMPVKAVYAASKSALIHMSRALREELKPFNATVTALCPAGMATNEYMTKNMSVQGMAGRMTTLQLCTIAASAVDKALRGKAVYVPGFINRLVVLAGGLTPPALVCRLIYRRWKKVNQAYVEALNAAGMPVK